MENYFLAFYGALCKLFTYLVELLLTLALHFFFVTFIFFFFSFIYYLLLLSLLFFFNRSDTSCSHQCGAATTPNIRSTGTYTYRYLHVQSICIYMCIYAYTSDALVGYLWYAALCQRVFLFGKQRLIICHLAPRLPITRWMCRVNLIQQPTWTHGT